MLNCEHKKKKTYAEDYVKFLFIKKSNKDN